jgi:hypothetical protein
MLCSPESDICQRFLNLLNVVNWHIVKMDHHSPFMTFPIMWIISFGQTPKHTFYEEYAIHLLSFGKRQSYSHQFHWTNCEYSFLLEIWWSLNFINVIPRSHSHCSMIIGIKYLQFITCKQKMKFGLFVFWHLLKHLLCQFNMDCFWKRCQRMWHLSPMLILHSQEFSQVPANCEWCNAQ